MIILRIRSGQARLAVCAIAITLTTGIAQPESPSQPRVWQSGTITQIALKHRGHFDPHAGECDLEILSQGVRYSTVVAYEIQKKDFVPGVGLIAVERRRRRTIDVTLGGTVSLAIDAAHAQAWLIDNQGVERKLIVKSSRVNTP